MKSTIPVITFVLFCLYVNVPARDINFTDWEGASAGQTVFNFLTIPVSAAQLARNGVASPLTMDATDIPLAPSATGFFENYTFAVTHVEWLMGLRKEYLGACFTLLDKGAISFYSQVFTFGDFPYARDIDEYPVDDVKAAEFSVGASYGRQIFYNRLSVGLAASYVESHLAGDAARGFNGSCDLLFKPMPWFAAHGYARHFGNEVTYHYTPELQPFQAGMALTFTPFGSKESASSSGFKMVVGAGAQKTIDEPLHIGASLDISPIRYFSIRTGYEYAYKQDMTPGGLSAGAGLNIRNYGIDAGWKYQAVDFGSVWALTVRYNTDKTIPRTAKEYFNVAMHHFARTRYAQAIDYAQKALGINPNLWEAHALIVKALTEINRKQGTEIVCIYSGNARGEFNQVPVNGVLMGGLSRQAAVIKQLRNENPITFAINVGNMISQASPVPKAYLADRYYALTGFDAVGLGSGELEFGFEKLCREAKKSSLKYICTNCGRTMKGDYCESKIITAGRYSIAVLNLVPVTVSGNDSSKTKIALQTIDIIRHTQTDQVARCDLRILITNDTWEQVQYWAKNIPLIDIILCGSIQQSFETPTRAGSTPVFSVGEYGKNVGALTLRFDKSRKLVSFSNRLIPVTEKIVPDPSVEKLVKMTTVAIDSAEEDDAKKEVRKGNTDGVFVFISDKHGMPEVYIKLLGKKFEIPIASQPHGCLKPRASFVNSSVFYLTYNDTAKTTECMKADLSGTSNEKMPFQGTVYEIVPDSEGKWLYASVSSTTSRSADIVRVTISGGDPQPVIAWKDGSEEGISFSHDKKHMLFTSNRDGLWQIYIADRDGNTPIRISDAPANHSLPRYSPGDEYISFLSDRGNFRESKDLWLLEATNGKITRITQNAKIQDYLWLDKQVILYTGGENLFDLNTINIFTGENRKFIISTDRKTYSETNPSVLLYKKDTYILYTREYLDGAKKLYMVKRDGSQDRQATFDKGNSWIE